VHTKNAYKTPLLTTATTAPLNLLEKKILSQPQKIEDWFQRQWEQSRSPVYGSVDLRNAGFKLAPVDMNLFPAGFNNLNPDFLILSIEAARHIIKKFVPTAEKILLVPENHTRNLFYWENIKTLIAILTEAGFMVRLGSMTSDVTDIELKEGDNIPFQAIERSGNQIHLKEFIPDVILLNNDTSHGIPDVLRDLSQPIIPPAELGWSQRLKSEHFQYYADVAQSFAQLIDIDSWLIAPLFLHCGEIDFMKREGEESLAHHVEQLLTDIQKKYDEYQITCKPFVVVKADAGTYGMAVMTIRDKREIQSLNRKQRTHMAKTKGGQPVHRVIVQEGIYTFETWDEAVAEPVVYLWGERVVGGFYRVHKERGIDENLNAPGMHFEPLAFQKPCHQPSVDALPGTCQNRFYAYGVIARLSMLAAAREIQALKSNESNE